VKLTPVTLLYLFTAAGNLWAAYLIWPSFLTCLSTLAAGVCIGLAFTSAIESE
jgi:hypothetical protein